MELSGLVVDSDAGTRGVEELARREGAAQENGAQQRGSLPRFQVGREQGTHRKALWEAGRAASGELSMSPGATRGSGEGRTRVSTGLGGPSWGAREGRMCEEGLRGRRRCRSTRPTGEQRPRAGDAGSGSSLLHRPPLPPRPRPTFPNPCLTLAHAVPSSTPRPHQGMHVTVRSPSARETEAESRKPFSPRTSSGSTYLPGRAPGFPESPWVQPVYQPWLLVSYLPVCFLTAPH